MEKNSEENKKIGVPVKCKKCGHLWNTKSDFFYINCPNCRTSNKRAEVIQNG